MPQKKHGSIEEFLLQNPIDRSQPNPYQPAAKALGVDKEHVRRAWRNLRQRGLVEQNLYLQIVPPSFTTTTSSPDNNPSVTYTYTEAGGSAQISKSSNREIKNELDLAEDCDIDLSTWRITKWECKRYNAWIKNKEGEIESQPKYSVFAKMERIKCDTDLGKQKAQILKELFETAPDVHIADLHIQGDLSHEKDRLLEISIFDHHFGKLAWGEETGDDYDLKIACQRFQDAVRELIAEVNLERIERIVFPIGNDMINIDNNNNTTTSGTPQSVDGRFPKILKTVRHLLVDTLIDLAVIAPVDVIVVPGNHDYNTMFTLGEILEARFYNTPKITVFNEPTPRKYYQYGVNGFQYTHGNEEKQLELGLIFANEEPQIWADTIYRVCKVGHFHKKKRLDFVSVDEHPGFQIETLPSLSGTDSWHKKKGYQSIKSAKSFVYDKVKGKVGEFYYNL